MNGVPSKRGALSTGLDVSAFLRLRNEVVVCFSPYVRELYFTECCAIGSFTCTFRNVHTTNQIR